MRDSDLIARACADLEQLQWLVQELAHVRGDFYLWGFEVGYPSGASDSAIGRGRKSDPTATAALRRDGDEFAQRMAQNHAAIDDHLDAIHHATTKLVKLAREATITRSAKVGAPGCTSCARVKDHDGQPLWTKPYEKSRDRLLCRWCSDFVRDWGVPPASALVELHVRDGRKVTTKTIGEHMPELRERVKSA